MKPKIYRHLMVYGSFIAVFFYQVLELQNTLDDLTHRVDKVRIGINTTRMFIRASAKNPVKWTLDKTLGNLSEHCLKILTRWRRRTWSWKVKMVCWDNTLKISCRYRNSCCGLATIYCCNFCFYRPAMCSKQSVPSPGGKKAAWEMQNCI